MDELRPALERLNLPADRLDLVQARVEARLKNDTPSAWCATFRSRVEALMAAQIFSQPYAEAYHALRGQLVAQGIAVFQGEHGMAVPDEEIDRTTKPAPKPARPPLPLDFAPRRDKSLPFVAPMPAGPSGITVTATPPVLPAGAILTPAVNDPASVLDGGSAVDANTPTPEHRDTIHGMFCQRNDDSWVLECDVLRGARIQVCTVMDDGKDVSYEADLPGKGSLRLDLRLPPGRTPVTTVVVVLSAENTQVGRGIIGGAAN